MTESEEQRRAELELSGTVANAAQFVYELTGWPEDACLRGAERLLDLFERGLCDDTRV